MSIKLTENKISENEEQIDITGKANQNLSQIELFKCLRSVAAEEDVNKQ